MKRARMVLKNLTHQFPRKWKQFLPLAVYIINNSVSDETGLPPYTAHFAKLPKPLSEMEVEIPMQAYEDDGHMTSEDDEAEGQGDHRTIAQRMMSILIKLSAEIAHERHMRYQQEDMTNRQGADNLNSGDVVWLLDHQIRTRKADERKMLNPRTGPFMIKKVSHDRQNAILYMGGGQTKRINVRLLQRYVGRRREIGKACQKSGRRGFRLWLRFFARNRSKS